MSDKQVGRDEGVKKIWSLIKDIRIGMLTTITEDGHLRSRPMGTQREEFDGTLWFFTHASEPKVDEVQHDQRVNVSFSKPDDNMYVSLSGTATLVRDRNKMAQLWEKPLKTWFPKELEDPDLALLRIDVDQAEYWDQHGGIMEVVVGFVKASVTGKESNAGYGVNVKMDE